MMDADEVATRLLEQHYQAGVAVHQKTTIEISPATNTDSGKICKRLGDEGIPFAFNGISIWLTSRYFEVFGKQLKESYGCGDIAK